MAGVIAQGGTRMKNKIRAVQDFKELTPDDLADIRRAIAGLGG